PAAATARPEEAVEIAPHHQVRSAGRRRRHPRIVEPAVERVKAGAGAEGAQRDRVTMRLEAGAEVRERDVGAAALARIERRGGEDRDAQRGGPGGGGLLAALEAGRALLEERGGAFLVVLTVERLQAELGELGAMPVGDALEDGAHLGLGAADGQRRIARDLAEILARVRLELGGGHQALDESDAQR